MVETTGQFRALKYYTLSGFFVIGVVTVLLGQVLPILSMRLGLDDAQAGTLFVAQFLGSAIGTLCASRIWRRYGFVVTTVVGLGMMIIGLPGLNFQNFALCWIAIFVYGSGLGMTIPAINLLTIEMTPESSRTSAVNLINFAWGVGAICSQPFVAVVSPPDSIVSVTIILDATLLLLLFCYLLLMKRIPASKDDSSVRTRLSIWRRPSSWLFLAFGFFVIGIESGMGGWLTTYSRSLTGRDQAINATVLFFAFMVLGRGLASIVSRYLSDSVLISVCACTLLTGIFLIVFGETFAYVGAAVAGLGTSAIFPTNMARFARIFGPTAIRSATPLFMTGIAGAASLSWLIGIVSTNFGSLRIGIVVLLISAVIVLFLQAMIVMVFGRQIPGGGK